MSSEDQVRSAFESLRVEARGKKTAPPSVAAVAARAGISRSSMYRFHPTVVAEIRAANGARDAKKQDQLRLKVQLLASQLKAEKRLSAALARACAELATQKAVLAEELADARLSAQLRVQHLENQLQGRKNVRLLHSKE